MENRRVIFKDEKNRIFVYETGNLLSKKKRCLTFTNPETTPYPANQGCMLLKHKDFLLFDYTKFLMGSLLLNSKPRKILIIGLGIGSVAKAISKILPSSQISIVEINENVKRVAIGYFDFKETEKVKVILNDGYKFIMNEIQRNESYDLIIMDAFNENYIPAHFLKMDFFQGVKNILSEKGVFALNTYSISDYSQIENDLMTEIFGNFYILEIKNKVMISTKSEIPDFKTIKNNSLFLEKDFSKIGIDTSWLLKHFKKK